MADGLRVYAWDCFPHLLSKVFPSTFTLRRGIQFHVFFFIHASLELGGT